MRGNKRNQLMHAERKVLEQNRSGESKVRKEKRKAKGKAAEIAKAIQRSPAGRKAAETLTEKRRLAQRARAGELPEAPGEIGSAIGRKKKANPGRAARQDRRVRPWWGSELESRSARSGFEVVGRLDEEQPGCAGGLVDE